MRLTLKRVNGIKEGYWSPCRKDELTERLAMYEDLGFSPEDLALILMYIDGEGILKEAMKE